MRITEPLPNCRSICASAASIAFSRSVDAAMVPSPPCLCVRGLGGRRLELRQGRYRPPPTTPPNQNANPPQRQLSHAARLLGREILKNPSKTVPIDLARAAF